MPLKICRFVVVETAGRGRRRLCAGSAVKLSWVFAMRNAGLALSVGAEVQDTALSCVIEETISPHLTDMRPCRRPP